MEGLLRWLFFEIPGFPWTHKWEGNGETHWRRQDEKRLKNRAFPLLICSSLEDKRQRGVAILFSSSLAVKLIYQEPDPEEKIRNNEKIKGIKTSKGESKLILYADDAVVTLQNPEDSIKELITQIEEYSKISGYKVNWGKSEALAINLADEEKAYLAKLGGFEWAKKHINHIGIKIVKDPAKIVETNFLPMLLQMNKKLQELKYADMARTGQKSDNSLSFGSQITDCQTLEISCSPDMVAGCILLVSITEQLAQVHNSSTKEALTRLCSYLPAQPNLSGICDLLVELFGPDLIKLIDYKWNGDVICHAMKLCNTNPGQPVCHLYQKPKGGLKKAIMQAEKIVEQSNSRKNFEVVSDILIKICSLPILQNICETIETSTPLEDFDHDNFSGIPTLRGFHWRGRDCNDIDKSVYPGQRPKDWDALQDSNCNGIWGFDSKDGIPYEKKFCEGTDAKGIIVLGDSAAAHFHIPPEWMSPRNMSKETFADLPLALSNELDWPQFSLYTGFQNSTIGGWTQSLYLHLRNWNRCNHRDYQNIARNGGSSNNIHSYVESLARNQQLDKPAVVFYALIGNDVCNSINNTLEHMTTPEEMKANVLTTLKFLDAHLPNGSHVVLVQLADGRFLWNSLHDRYHPVGQFNQDVKYKQLYSFMSCLQINPCEGWMTSNETLQNLTTKRADELSSALKEIASSYKFNNFDVNYFESLYKKVIAEWSTYGGKTWELIEPVDGFHPNQIASAIGADIIWREATQNWPELFGKKNPHNQEIIAKFGDQGGH
ncbi:acyloxyacyl hydrolase [Pelodytes ibericus]